MTVDKNELKRIIDGAKPNQILVSVCSAIDKDGGKRIKTEVEKFVAKNSDFVLIVVNREK